MRTLTVLLLLIAAILLMAGCGAREPQRTGTGILVSNKGGTAEVQEVTLKDGTRCAVLIGYHRGAITCNWRQP